MATLIIKLQKFKDAIRARHLFGLMLIALAIAIAIRPLGTVIFIQSGFGIPPLAYAGIISICGALLLIINNAPWYIRWALTSPYVIYLISTFELIADSNQRPYTTGVIYSFSYLMVLYFMTKEN